MHNSFYRAILHNSLITNQKTILGCAPFIFLPVVWGGNPGVAGNWSVYAPDAPKTYKDITITIVANATPKIHYWEGGDKMVGSEWDAKPEMVATGEENTYSYTIKDVDEATGVKYLVVVGDVQSADQLAFENVNKNFKELLPQVSVMGVTGWDGDKMTVADDYLSASVTLTLDATKDYELKLTVNGDWFGSNAITITKDNNSASFAENGDGNGKLTTDLAGDYVFTYTYATKTLVVTYPVPTYTVTVTTENGTVEGDGEYKEGTEVTLTATPAEGYQFVNWTVGEEVVSTENPYSFVVTADVALVANFELIPPTKYNVTVTAENGTVEGAGEYEEGTTATLTATPAEGYQFVNWTVGEEVVSTENPYSFVVTANIALVANFELIPVVEPEKPEPTYTENNLNPYAFGLESKLSADKETLTVTYRLNNSNATSVNVVVYNGEEVVATVAGTTTIGKNTVEVPTADLQGGVELTWAVEVNGTSVEAPTQEGKSYSFWGPRGLAIDTDPESENFGRILVTESYYGTKDMANYVASGKGSGIYTFNPSFTTDSVVYTGGNDFSYVLGAKTGFQPWRVKISEDGRIFVSSLDLNGVVVWEVSKDLQTWTPVISGAHNADDYRIYDEEGNFVAGPNVSMDVIGSGENLKLLLYSTNKNGIAFNQAGYRLDEYALGTATTWTGTPKNILEGGKYGLVHTDVDFVYDGEGGYWFGGSRGGTAGEPNLVHINAEGVEDYRDETTKNYGGAGVLVQNGMLIKGKARTSAAVGNIGIYTIGKDAEGKVTLTEKWTVASTLGRNHNAFAFDYAGNLYVIGNSKEKIIAYAMPYSGTVETPAASKYAFQLEGEPEVQYEVYEDEITNLVFDLESMMCYGGPSANFQVDVFLVLGEENGDGTVALDEESSISVQGSDATFIEGYLKNIDVYAPKADAVIRCDWKGTKLELHLAMSAAPIEATVVVVENAAVEIEKYLLFGDTYDYALKMTGVWTDAEGLDYPVLVEVPVYYPEATEPTEVMSTVTVGSWDEGANWLGFGEGYLTITTVGDVVTATGVVENPMAGIAIDITISGSLSQGPGTALENATVVIKSIKKIQNGQLIIEKGGVQYNAQGAIVK